MIASIQQNATDPLERLLTQRVGLLWLQAHYVDIQLAMAEARTPKEQEYLDKRRDISQAAYATAIHALRNYQQSFGAESSRKPPRR